MSLDLFCLVRRAEKVEFDILCTVEYENNSYACNRERQGYPRKDERKETSTIDINLL